MSNDINQAIAYAVDICNDETHGYSNGDVRPRNLNPDTDCSGLVYYALKNGGQFENIGSLWYTGNMMDRLRAMGFTEYVFNPGHYGEYVPVHGDICVHRESDRGHAMFYAENVLGFPTKESTTRSIIPQAMIEAIKDYDNHEGDSRYEGDKAYREVWVHNWQGLYNPTGVTNAVWHVFRWGGAPGPTPPGNPLPIWLMFKMKEGV